MIDLEQVEGTQVRFLGPEYPDLGVEVGQVGIIAWVDTEDSVLTYKVKFPNLGWSLWVHNNRLTLVDALEEEMCGWKPRALKAEAELGELKKALKTLSED